MKSTIGRSSQLSFRLINEHLKRTRIDFEKNLSFPFAHEGALDIGLLYLPEGDAPTF
jgi:hypothetical protein